MITQENKQQLEGLLKSPLTKEQILARLNGQYDLEKEREKALELVQRMVFAFWEGVHAWVYDDILWNMNAMIDRTQEIMIKQATEKAEAEKKIAEEKIAREKEQENQSSTPSNEDMLDDEILPEEDEILEDDTVDAQVE